MTKRFGCDFLIGKGASLPNLTAAVQSLFPHATLYDGQAELEQWAEAMQHAAVCARYYALEHPDYGWKLDLDTDAEQDASMFAKALAASLNVEVCFPDERTADPDACICFTPSGERSARGLDL